MHRQHLTSLVALSLLACSPRAQAVEVPAVEGAAAWEQLAAALPGVWEASMGEHTVTVSYRLTARETVLLETWMPGTAAETISTYHLDGDVLMLTHYCGQGNQPRLRLDEEGPSMHFSRFDATDLGAEESALLELGLTLDATDTLTRNETYAQGSERDVTTLVFDRLRAETD